MEENNNSENIISSLLFILFVVMLILKLTGYISSSWWIVTLPLWIAPAIVISILLVLLGIGIVVGIVGLVTMCFGKIKY